MESAMSRTMKYGVMIRWRKRSRRKTPMQRPLLDDPTRIRAMPRRAQEIASIENERRTVTSSYKCRGKTKEEAKSEMNVVRQGKTSSIDFNCSPFLPDGVSEKCSATNEDGDGVEKTLFLPEDKRIFYFAVFCHKRLNCAHQ